MAQNPHLSCFPASWGLIRQNINNKNVANNHAGQRGHFFLPVSGPLAPENFVFLFLSPALNFSKCPRPKMGQKPTKSPFLTGGGPTEKKLFPGQLRKTIPDSVVTFFSFDFGTPSALRTRKGPVELACCLLAAAAAC